MKSKKVFGKKNIFVEHIVRDETVHHLCPKQHLDFFYSYIRIDITPKQLKNVIMLSGSVGYDPLKKMLYARCAGLAPNIATLKIATDIIIEKKVKVELEDDDNNSIKISYKTLRDIQKKGIYGKTIRKCIDNKFFLKETYINLAKNIKIIGVKKDIGYWKGAFDIKNNKCVQPLFH